MYHTSAYICFNLPYYFSPYVEDIPYSLEHRPYPVSIAAHLATLGQNRILDKFWQSIFQLNLYRFINNCNK